jgi:hypothetical protein
VPSPRGRGGATLAAKGEPIAVDEPKVLPVERSRTVASDRPDHGPY